MACDRYSAHGLAINYAVSLYRTHLSPYLGRLSRDFPAPPDDTVERSRVHRVANRRANVAVTPPAELARIDRHARHGQAAHATRHAPAHTARRALRPSASAKRVRHGTRRHIRRRSRRRLADGVITNAEHAPRRFSIEETAERGPPATRPWLRCGRCRLEIRLEDEELPHKAGGETAITYTLALEEEERCGTRCASEITAWRSQHGSPADSAATDGAREARPRREQRRSPRHGCRRGLSGWPSRRAPVARSARRRRRSSG